MDLLFSKGRHWGSWSCADSTKPDTWVEDCSIAAILVQMVAESLDLGSCWIQIRLRPHDEGTTAESYIQELLGLPPNIKVQSIISIGHPSQRRAPLSAEQLQYGKVKRNHYAEPFK